MAFAFSGSSLVRISGNYKDTGRDLTSPSVPVAIEASHDWAAGSAFRLYDNTLSLAAASFVLDLYGAVTDLYGNTLNFALIKAIYVKNKATTTAYDLHLSGTIFTGSLLTGWVDDAAKLIIEPGGVFYLTSPTDGYAVTAGTKDSLIFDPGANTFDVDVVIWGTVAS